MPQSIKVDFYGVTSVFFLPKEEGGQGLVDLESRKADFRLQFYSFFSMGIKMYCGDK